MRRIAGLVVGLMMLSTGALFAQEASPLRTISVSGTVEAEVAPDRIIWKISLKDFDKDLREAMKRNDEKMESMVALREKLQIDEGDFETGHMSIRREYERGQYGSQGAFRHFVVTRSVTIRQRQLERFDEYLDTFVSSAEMEVHFGFESTRIHEVRAETRLEAIKAAKEKAGAMADAAGAKLGRVLTINEHPEDGSRIDSVSNVAVPTNSPSVDVASGRFVPGAIKVQVTVYATFELK